MKLLGMINLADIRIISMKSEEGTYSSIERIIERLQEL
jgi:hypothetical protein